MSEPTPTEDYGQWVGRTEVLTDDLSLATSRAAAATFDEDPEALQAGGELPPLWHWFYFLPKARMSDLAEDGHPRRTASSFLPPIPYPRRMFAGARLIWHRPLLIGQPARREAVIRKVTMKSGRSGKLAFVTVGHRIFQEDQLCLEEEQDIVYREPGPPLPAPEVVEFPPLPSNAWSRIVVPETRLLFRFSALTFNAHRIHYDRPYAMSEEGYPGLVVHGPLTAILLTQLVRQNMAASIRTFEFRGRRPLFDLHPFRLVGIANGGQVELEAQGPDAETAMTAKAET